MKLFAEMNQADQLTDIMHHPRHQGFVRLSLIETHGFGESFGGSTDGETVLIYGVNTHAQQRLNLRLFENANGKHEGAHRIETKEIYGAHDIFHACRQTKESRVDYLQEFGGHADIAGNDFAYALDGDFFGL